MPADRSSTVQPTPREGAADRAEHLLTPERTDSLVSLSDAELDQRVAQQRIAVDQQTASVFGYAIDFAGDDLSRDAKYRQMLIEMKSRETELGRLEDEQHRRRAATRRTQPAIERKSR